MSVGIILLDHQFDTTGVDTLTLDLTSSGTGGVDPTGDADTILGIFSGVAQFDGTFVPTGITGLATWNVAVKTRPWNPDSPDPARRLSFSWAPGVGVTPATVDIEYGITNGLIFGIAFEANEVDDVAPVVADGDHFLASSGTTIIIDSGASDPLPAVSNANNRIVAATMTNQQTTAIDPITPWIQLAQLADTGPAARFMVQSLLNDNEPDSEWGPTTALAAMLAVELKHKAAGTAHTRTVGSITTETF